VEEEEEEGINNNGAEEEEEEEEGNNINNAEEEEEEEEGNNILDNNNNEAIEEEKEEAVKEQEKAEEKKEEEAAKEEEAEEGNAAKPTAAPAPPPAVPIPGNGNNDDLGKNDVNNPNNNGLNNNIDNGGDLLTRPKKHLGGLQDALASVLEKFVHPISEEVDELKEKLVKTKPGPQIHQIIKPLEAKIDAVDAGVKDSGEDLESAVNGVKSSIEDLKSLRSELEGKASGKDVEAFAKMWAAEGKMVSGSMASSDYKQVYKDASKTQKYLKRLYKDLHGVR